MSISKNGLSPDNVTFAIAKGGWGSFVFNKNGVEQGRLQLAPYGFYGQSVDEDDAIQEGWNASLRYISFGNTTINVDSTVTLGFIPSGCLMIGHVLEGANCAYINIVQDQAGGIFGTNTGGLNVTIKGKIYYRRV